MIAPKTYSNYKILDQFHIRVWNDFRNDWKTYDIRKDWIDLTLNDTGIIAILKRDNLIK